MGVLPCGSYNYLVLFSLQRIKCTPQVHLVDNPFNPLFRTSEKTGPQVPSWPVASGYYRRALWFQIRNPKLEARNKFKCPMVQGQEPPAVQWFWSFPAWCLGFVSGFEFRISGFRALNGGSSKMRPSWPLARAGR